MNYLDIKKILACSIAISLVTIMLFNVSPTLVAHTEASPLIVTLWADQNINVGSVSVWNDGDNVHVEYDTIDGWLLTYTHLYIGKTNPEELTSAPGQFPYHKRHIIGVDSYPYVIALDDIDGYHLKLNKQGKQTGVWVSNGTPGVDVGDTVYIAVQALVCKIFCETAWGEGDEFGTNWAMYFTYDIQSTQQDYPPSACFTWADADGIGVGTVLNFNFSYCCITSDRYHSSNGYILY